MKIDYAPGIIREVYSDSLDPCASENLSRSPWALIVTRSDRQIIVRSSPGPYPFFFVFEGKKIEFTNFEDAQEVANRLADLPTKWRKPWEITEQPTPYAARGKGGEAA